MDVGLVLPVKLAEQIGSILEDLCRRTGAEYVLLADSSGQLISAQGKMAGASSQMQKFDTVHSFTRVRTRACICSTWPAVSC